MNSIRCSQCGLLNWETAQWCKRCKTNLQSNNLNPPTGAPFSSSASNTASFNQPPNTSNYPPPNNQNYQTPPNNPNYSSPPPNNSSREGSSGNGHQYRSAKPFFDAKNGFIAKNIERCNRNVMITCILTIVVIISGVIMNSRYLYNVAFGPFPVANERLGGSVTQADSLQYYVKINAEEVFDTGSRYVQQKRGAAETVKYKYVALQVGDKLLLAKVAPNSPLVDGAKNISVNGSLERLNGAETQKVLDPILKEQPELRSEFLPYLLDATNDFYLPAYIGGGIGAILLLVAGGFLLSVLGKIGNLEKSSLMKSLTAYGNPREVAALIDAEVSAPHEKIGPIYLLPSWVIQRGTFSVNVQHVEDVVWMYKKVTKHSVNFIPTGKTYEVVIHNKTGASVSLTGTFLGEQKADLIMENIYRRVPWIIAGYDNELVSTWNSNTTAFVQAVSERRTAYMNETAQARPQGAF